MLGQENEETQTGIDFKNAMYSIQTGPDATSLPVTIKLLRFMYEDAWRREESYEAEEQEG